MSKTRIEQYPNSLMTVSKILSKRNKKYIDSMDTPIDNSERNNFYQNKEQYQNDIDTINDSINEIDIDIDALDTALSDIFIKISFPSSILKKITQNLLSINKIYKNKIIKNHKYYDIYDLQEIETNIKDLSEKYSKVYSGPNMIGYLQNTGSLKPLVDRTKDLFNITKKIVQQTSQRVEGIDFLPPEPPREQYVGGYLSSISDLLASNYRIK